MSLHEKQADLIYKAVKTSSVSPLLISKGDLIVVTAANNDTVGIVKNISTIGDVTSVDLNTTSGIRTLQVNDTNFIHIIQKVSMLSLKNHEDYERVDDEIDVISKNKDEHKERPEFSVDKSDKSNLPTSKISLNLRKNK